MKRIFVILSVLIVFSMILAACGTPTPAATTEAPAATTEAPAAATTAAPTEPDAAAVAASLPRDETLYFNG
ncbi:ABC transporter substrate-binding protein, partial [bacterium]|nr:ABC transporter substrate-binding protein [bacterium]